MHAATQSPNPPSNAPGVACGDLVVWVCRYCGSKNVYRAFNVQCCMDCARAVCADARDSVPHHPALQAGPKEVRILPDAGHHSPHPGSSRSSGDERLHFLSDSRPDSKRPIAEGRGTTYELTKTMPAGASIIALTTNGVTKYYIRLWNGLIEPYIPPSERRKCTGEW